VTINTYDDLKNLQNELIRKSLGGSMWLAPFDTADPWPEEPFVYTAAVTGPPAVPASVSLVAKPAGYDDAGYLSDDGIAQSNEVSESDVTSWQSTTPTRSDITSDVDNITIVMQETKLLSIGLYTGANLAADARNATTGTLFVPKPERPSARFYRGFALAVDGEGDDEFFIGRIYPRLKVTGKSDQNYAKGDDPLSWGVTFRAFVDSDLGYSVGYVFGGMGWRNALADMGFTAAS
jgi:hypothetical protein